MNPIVHRGRILMVDDAQPVLMPTRAYLETVGWEVDCVSEVGEARRRLSEGGYDVAVIEPRLSPEDEAGGLALVDLALESSPRTHVIALTAYGSSELKRELLRRGVDAYLQKPTSLSTLALLMSNLVGRADKGSR